MGTDITLPDIRDVLRHLVHHAPGLSPEMREQYDDAISRAYPGAIGVAGVDSPAGLDAGKVAGAASALAVAEAAVDALVTPVPAPETPGS